MPTDDLITRAAAFARQAHRGIDQRRKFTGQPYEVHLQAVAALVAEVSDDPRTVAAAWLHDVVEDTPVRAEDVEREFGPELAALVAELTDVSRPGDGNRAARVALDRAHLAGASARGQTVKLADLIDNCRDIVAQDPGFARVYLPEKAALYRVLTRGDARLRRRAFETLQAGARRLGIELELGDEPPAPTRRSP